MNTSEHTVTTADDLVALTKDTGVREIVVPGTLANVPSIRLSPGQSLRGEDEQSGVVFAGGTDRFSFLRTTASAHSVSMRLPTSAIFNDTDVDSLGRIELRGVTTTGRVQILARNSAEDGRVDVNGLDIVAADAQGESERPHGYGVYVLHGAFTLRNMQPEDDVIVSADLVGLSAGRDGGRCWAAASPWNETSIKSTKMDRGYCSADQCAAGEQADRVGRVR